MTQLTRLGQFLANKSVNKARVARRAGLTKNKLTDITTKESARLTAEELYLVALAIDVNPCELLEYVCEGVTLKEETAGK